MNLLLLYKQDFIAPGRVQLQDRRLQHLLSVKKVQLNEQLEVGLLNDKVGLAQVTYIDKQKIELNVKLHEQPVAPLPVHLILALPRPKMLKRILQTISAMGVKRLSLIHSSKVEKSFWQSPWLEPEKLNQHLILGLEQAKDTILPEVQCFKLFKPFVEDVLPEMIIDTRALVAHPGRGDLCMTNEDKAVTLAIGPEGGFTDYEVDKLLQAGFTACHLGERILRVENAIPVLLGRLL